MSGAVLTPERYWRVPAAFDEDAVPAEDFELPNEIASQGRPPKVGDGLIIAAYCDETDTGFFRWVGTAISGGGARLQVQWRELDERIWVQYEMGRRKWRQGAFCFAAKKVADYGLHELWTQHFEGLTVREPMQRERAPKTTTILKRSRTGAIARERLEPIEVFGAPSSSPRAGVVYLLKSAYGYKVGRTGSVPSRMRAFGVQLPFAYTIPLCIWYEDCHAAERRFHAAYADKRINGEWFDLAEADIDAMRSEGLMQASAQRR